MLYTVSPYRGFKSLPFRMIDEPPETPLSLAGKKRCYPPVNSVPAATKLTGLPNGSVDQNIRSPHGID